MLYAPRKQTSRSRQQVTTQMAPDGMVRDISEIVMNIDQALLIQNYIPEGPAKLRKRKGQKVNYDPSSSSPVTANEHFRDNLYVHAYGTNLEIVDKEAGTATTLKSDWSSDGEIDVAVYGDFIFAVNGVDPLYRFQRELTASSDTNQLGGNIITYGTQTSNYTVGRTVTGATSGATGTITADDDSGTTGTLTVTSTNAVDFIIGEILADDLGGSATITALNPLAAGDTVKGQTSGFRGTIVQITGAGTNSQTMVMSIISGTPVSGEVIVEEGLDTVKGRSNLTSALTWSANAVSAAPIARIVRAIDDRLHLGDINGERSSEQFSEADAGDAIPFTNWTVSAAIEGPDKTFYRAGGVVKDIVPLGPYKVVFQEKGFYAYLISAISDGSQIVKNVETVDYELNFGAGKAALTTDKGIFTANAAGGFQYIQLGQHDVPYSRQKIEFTQPLGRTYFEDISFASSDIVHDLKNKMIWIACARDSDVNNLLLGFHTELKTLVELQGWNHNTLFKIDQELYAGSALDGKAYKLFEGNDDAGVNISTEFYQELNFGDYTRMKTLLHSFFQGKLHPESEITISFDIYDWRGAFIRSYGPSYTWSCQNGGGVVGMSDEFSELYGEDEELVNSPDDYPTKINNFLRIRVRVQCSDGYPHILELMTFLAEIKSQTRIRNITKNS